MSRLIRNIAVCLLLIAFTVPAIGYAASYFTGGSDVSVTENRTLASLPKFEGKLRDFTTAFDTHLEDRFGFRMIMIRTARKIRDNLGENPPQVIYGKNDWLFLGENAYRDEFEGNGLWNAAQVDRWIESLSRMKEEAESRNIPFVAAIAVDKARLYPEYLPDGWTESERRFRSALYAHPDVDRTGLFDVEPILKAEKAAGEQVFYRRDTHWTPGGTYKAAMELIDLVDPERILPRFDPAPATTWKQTRVLDLDKMAGFETSQEPEITMIRPLRPPGRYRTFINLKPDGTPERGSLGTLRLTGMPDAADKRLVIIGDSFADSMVTNWYSSYSEIIRVHFGAHIFDVTPEEVFAYEPDAIIFLVAERQAARKARPLANIDLR